MRRKGFATGLTIGSCIGLLLGSAGGALAWSVAERSVPWMPPYLVMTIEPNEAAGIYCNGNKLEQVLAKTTNESGLFRCI